MDMESEISKLESTIREQDQQLSSFKTILEGKEASLVKQRDMETKLTGKLQSIQMELETLRTAKDTEIDRLESELSLSLQNAHDTEEKAKNLENSFDELATQEKELNQSLQEKDAQLAELECTIQDVRTEREKMETELASKSDEVLLLSESVENQKRAVDEKESEISRHLSKIELLERSVQDSQLTNDALRSNVDSSREESVGKVAEYSRKVLELEQTVSELQSQLRESLSERESVAAAQQALEEKLGTTQEILQQRENKQKEMAELNLSFSQQCEESEVEVKELRQTLAAREDALRAATGERDAAMEEVERGKSALAEKMRILKLEKEEILAKYTESQLQVQWFSVCMYMHVHSVLANHNEFEAWG